ncbi:MAG: nucleoside hydrolase [Candidatus Zhuqueibacterota bacterium]
MNRPQLTDVFRLERLLPRAGTIDMVLDTDTYNEIDDQFAVVYSLVSPERLNVRALYAAPFYNERSESPGDGMERSYEEIIRLLSRMNVATDHFVFRGATAYLPDAATPVVSDAAAHLIQTALAQTEAPLYVAAIGAITNVASAILMEPKIIEKIIVVWLGGHAYFRPHTAEFNLIQDIHAARLIFDCGVPLVHIPCHGVASHLITTASEIESFVRGCGPIGDYLADIFQDFHTDHFGVSKVLWDIATIAWLINPEWIATDLVHSPILTDQATWSFDTSRHLIRAAHTAFRDPIFRDFFTKLRTVHSAV